MKLVGREGDMFKSRPRNHNPHTQINHLNNFPLLLRLEPLGRDITAGTAPGNHPRSITSKLLTAAPQHCSKQFNPLALLAVAFYRFGGEFRHDSFQTDSRLTLIFLGTATASGDLWLGGGG
jgi:hypothetical protein